MNKKSILFLIGFLLFAFSTYVQKVIKGKVTDASDGSGIPGVSVLVKGTNAGTNTQADGSFTLNVPQNGTTLVVSSIGYVSKEIAIGNSTTITVSLSATSQDLE